MLFVQMVLFTNVNLFVNILQNERNYVKSVSHFKGNLLELCGTVLLLGVSKIGF